MTKEKHYLDFCKMVDCASWAEAREFLAKTIDDGNEDLAKQMNEYYELNKCWECHGASYVIEGEDDKLITKPCVCQIEN